jgi:hypothetical protein
MKKIIIFWIILFGSCIALFAQTHVPFQLSLVYPIGTNGTNTDVINHTSINIFAGMATGVEGLEIGGFANINKQNVSGIQLSGYLNVTGGNTKGVAIAGLGNISQSAEGFQGAGFINTAGNSSNSLVQLAGFSNIATSIQGAQLAGFLNYGKTVNGPQVSGFSNIAKTVTYTQLCGFANVAADSSRSQISGFANISGENTGTQLTSVVNIARQNSGYQIALVNIADSCDNQIGFVNIAKNSTQQISVWTDEILTTNVSYKTGGHRFYGYLGISAGADDNLRYGTNAGLGIRTYLTQKVRVDMELSSKFLFEKFDNEIDDHSDINYFNSSSLKALLVVPIGSRVELFAGPSINYRHTNSSKGAKIPSELSIWKDNDTNKNCYDEVFGGVTGGIAVKIN